jgi:pro-sigmaK processing inhibitor BofA
MPLIAEFLLLLAAIIIIMFLWKILEDPKQIAVNSIIGIVALWLINEFLGWGIPINWLTILIAALAGIPGLILIVLMHFLGLGF